MGVHDGKHRGPLLSAQQIRKSSKGKRLSLLLLQRSPQNLLLLSTQLCRELFDSAELHAECQAVMNAARVFSFSNTIGTQVAQVGRNRNLIPVEAVAAFTRIILLPRAVIKNADAPLANREVVLFLAGHNARLATSAEFVVNQKSVIRHADYQSFLATSTLNFSSTSFISVSKLSCNGVTLQQLHL